MKSNRWKQIGAFITILSFALMIGSTNAGKGKTSPPNSHAYGKDLTGWMNAFWTAINGGVPDVKNDRVKLLPIPDGEFVEGDGSAETPLVLEGEIDVDMSVGSPFVLGILSWTGEYYVQPECPDDEPLAPDLFLEADVLVTLDDFSLIDSEVDDLEDYYFDATFFDPRLPYDEPQNRGDCDAAGAIWVQGLGFVHAPLPPGEHTLVLQAGANFLGFHIVFTNTWNITVSN